MDTTIIDEKRKEIQRKRMELQVDELELKKLDLQTEIESTEDKIKKLKEVLNQ